MMNTTTIKPIPLQPAQPEDEAARLEGTTVQLEEEATRLAGGLRAGDADAIERQRQYYRFMGRKDIAADTQPDAALVRSDAIPVQPDAALAPAIVAREYGFADWEAMLSFVKEMGRPGSPVHAFELAVDAVINGDEQALKNLLHDNPSLAKARSSRVHHATLLHYTAANGVENYRQRTPSNIVPIARMLLDAGAEVDAPLMDGGKGTALGEVATSIHPEKAGVQLALMELLMDAGAAVDGQPGGWQPLMAALANGQPAAAVLLAERGPRMSVVAAAGLGREDLVRSFFTAAGEYIPTKERMWHVPEEPERQLVRAFMYACIYGHTGVVTWLIGHGVDPGAQDDDGYTGLHWAGHGGYLELVKLLLARGVPLELKNCHGGTVLGQVLWSAANNAGGWAGGAPNADYPAIAELLIEAGAVVEPGTLSWWLSEKGVRSPVREGMEAVLRRHGG